MALFDNWNLCHLVENWANERAQGTMCLKIGSIKTCEAAACESPELDAAFWALLLALTSKSHDCMLQRESLTQSIACTCKGKVLVEHTF